MSLQALYRNKRTDNAVGNRLAQETLIGSVPLTTNYVYDAANRLTSVDSDTYTWDNNGNLLNDGVNTYVYDSANRLTSFNGTSSYAYNGMGDRLQQTVNGNTTTYALDINTSLPEVLSDGQFTYLYGLDNIAQVNAGETQYFLGDALNSTRQLTDSSAQITLAQSYDPFGSVTFSAGNSQSVYGYTSEQSDPSGLVFLRARYYDPNAGRFTSRDTWEGNINQPLSLNQWNYVEGNPVNYTDPTGHIPECVVTMRANRINVDYADKYVNLSKSDWRNTYTAAGIAIQCWADLEPPLDERTSGQGPAQISNLQTESPYAETIEVGGGQNGFGVRCYINVAFRGKPSCTFCFTKDELANMSRSERNKYILEPIHDQKDITWATIYMKRKITAVTTRCQGCTDTDIFVAAALGQGSGFTPDNMADVSNPKIKDPSKNYVIPEGQRINNVAIDWQKYFNIRNHPRATSAEVLRFTEAALGLFQKGWMFPKDKINWNYISLISR